jgi:hypothetical protein
MAYFPLILHGSHIKQYVQQFFLLLRMYSMPNNVTRGKVGTDTQTTRLVGRSGKQLVILASTVTMSLRSHKNHFILFFPNKESGLKIEVAEKRFLSISGHKREGKKENSNNCIKKSLTSALHQTECICLRAAPKPLSGAGGKGTLNTLTRVAEIRTSSAGLTENQGPADIANKP